MGVTRHVALVTLAVAACLGRHAFAETTVGVEFDGGGATMTAPDDDAGEPTLLHGSAFTGPAFRVAAAADTSVVGPLSLGASVGFGRYAMNGHAERDGLRRELALRLSALEVLVRARLGKRDGTVRPFGGIGFGGRFGLAASSTETRVGFTSAEPAPAVTTGNAALLALEGGVVVVAGRIRIPVAAVATRNLTYGTTTRDRLDGYRNVVLPGSLVVDANWTYGLRVGLGWSW